MAAVKPHLGLDHQSDPLLAEYAACTTGLRGLGDAENCPTPGEVLAQSHGALLQTFAVREALLDELKHRSIEVRIGVPTEIDEETGEIKKSVGPGVMLRLSSPLPQVPEWSPLTSDKIRNLSLLAWTSKMGAPSFSLPAGPDTLGGACPGSVGGMSVAPGSENHRGRILNIVREASPDTRYDMAKAVCQHCYAEGGQYATANVQMVQSVRYAWAKAALDIQALDEPPEWMVRRRDVHPDVLDMAQSAFVVTMVAAIERGNFRTGLEPARWNGQRYFRLHDSGDFFSKEYAAAWKAVALHFDARSAKQAGTTPVVFWAPSRIWTFDDRRRHINEINANPDNLVIRPSAYFVDAGMPKDFGPGWAAPSLVLTEEGKELYLGNAYDCPAYLVTNAAKSCRAANGGKGCRTCWMRPDVVVNYTLH